MKLYSTLLIAAGLGTAAQAQLLMEETFSYPNGALTNVAAGSWNHHSGSGGALTLNVVDGRAFIRQADAEGGHDDYNRLFGAGFDPLTDNSTKLYAGFTVNFSAFPFTGGTFASGSYFAHFKSSSANEFYTRIGANEETPGNFRLALANEAWDAARTIEFPQNLELNRDYQVIVRLDLSTDQSTLWLNPTDESSTSVTAADAFTYAGVVNAFALRQGTTGTTPNIGAPGDIYIDNLRVGTSFESVIVPEPGALSLLGTMAACVWFVRRRK